MSISLATMGRLWPRANIIREQYVNLIVSVSDPTEVILEMVDSNVAEVCVVVSDNVISSSVEEIDTTVEASVDTDDIEGC